MGILGAEAHPLSPLSRSDIQASAAPRYVNVAVDAKTSLPGDEFTYAIPDTLNLRPGHLVQAPFGRRSVRGVVTSLTDVLRVDYAKPVGRLLHPEPLIDGPRMALARWIADYYMAPLFDALAPMLPPGWRGRARLTIWPVADVEEPADLSPSARRLLAYLRANPQPRQLARLVQALGPWAQSAARALVKAGVVEQRVVAPAVRVPRSVQAVLPAVAPGRPLRVRRRPVGAGAPSGRVGEEACAGRRDSAHGRGRPGRVRLLSCRVARARGRRDARIGPASRAGSRRSVAGAAASPHARAVGGARRDRRRAA